MMLCNNASLNAHPKSFSRCHRLTKSSDYRWEKQETRYKETASFSFLIRQNSKREGRIGIIVARKKFKKAVTRNRFKRIIRESFRCGKHYAKGYDVILIVKKGADVLNKRVLRKELDNQWIKLFT